MKHSSRKQFLRTAVLASSGLFLAPGRLISQNVNQRPLGEPLDSTLVKEFVGAAHKDLSKVQEMYIHTPDLLNSVNNLGAWDWEDAIGAAGHVGHREMAEFLLLKGARPTICVCAMMGKLDIVKAYITAFPEMKNAVGPHNISLLKHARAGGEQAKDVVEYLVSLGAK